eukprot:Nk52_evm59s343 gene=Nk52_evmTU59s343
MGGLRGEERCSVEDVITENKQEDGRKSVASEELKAVASVDTAVDKVASKEALPSKNKEDGVVEEAVIVNKEYLEWARDRVPGKFSQYLNLCVCAAQGPWDYSTDDFTDCFEQSVILGAIPLLTVLLAGLLTWGTLKPRGSGEYQPLVSGNDYAVFDNQIVPQNHFPGILRLLSTSVICLAQVFQLVFSVFEERPMYLQVTYGLVFLQFSFALMINMRERKALARVPWALGLFYFVAFLCGLLKVRSLLIVGVQTSTDTVFIISYFMLCVICACSCYLPELEPIYNEHGVKIAPEFQASQFAKWTYSWITPLIKLGSSRILNIEDVWAIPKDATSVEVCDQFEKIANEVKRNGHLSVRIVFLKLVRSHLFIQGLYLGIASIVGFLGPMLLGRVVSYIKEDPDSPNATPAWLACAYCIGLFLSPTIVSLGNQRFFHSAVRIGLIIRSATIGAVYRKSLRLSNAARQIETVGKITNLMAVDAERLRDAPLYLHRVWVAPVQILVAIGLLVNVVGISAFAGLLVMIGIMPINAYIAQKSSDIQNDLMDTTDNRINLTNEVLSGIRIIKFFAWENSFWERLTEARRKEMVNLSRYIYFGASSFLLWFGAPVAVNLATFASYCYIEKKELDATTVFTSLALFNVLKMPLYILPVTIQKMVEFGISMGRLEEFLNHSERDMSKRLPDSNPMVSIKEADFRWDKPCLYDIDIHVKKGQLACIVGPTGSGKTSLLMAMLDEMDKVTGSVNVRGTVAYAAQQAWILHGTVRDNILFGKPYDPVRYEKVVRACCLVKDFILLDAGDMTEIGEKGLNLSGGQKQRISLARAVYSDSDIIVMDDPLSAVDAHVAKHIFKECMVGFLKNKTRILVTHQVGLCLPQSDQVIMMENGTIKEQGVYKELYKQGKHLTELMHSVGIMDGKPMKDPEEDEFKFSDADVHAAMTKGMDQKAVTLVAEEERAEGSVGLEIYKAYFVAGGGVSSLIAITIVFSISQGMQTLQDYWADWWSVDMFHLSQAEYLKYYSYLGVATTISILIRSLMIAYVSIQASRNLHRELLSRILRAPMRFFDTTPLGRIVNRFSKDQQTIDQILSPEFQDLFTFVLMIVSTVAVIGFITPFFLVALVPVLFIYQHVSTMYQTSARELKRLDAVTRSPVYIHFAETLNGIPTIRAYGDWKRFIVTSNYTVDVNHSAFYGLMIANRWLGLRLEFIGACCIFFAGAFASLGKGTIDAGQAGLSLTYALQMTNIINWLVRTIAEVEMALNSVERVMEYAQDIPQERPAHIPQNTPASNWPQKGVVEISNLVCAYAPGLPAVLKNISMKSNRMEKIGVVGRTGAGKSSLMLVLFRLVEPECGYIKIDNVDISTIGLDDLRSKLSIIPQDPVLFTGTIRSNLDPFHEHDDVEVWTSLKRCHLHPIIHALPEQLEAPVTENGENFSVGQRQLLCLARALLKKSKVLVMDEATANVDVGTDALIQTTIRTEFVDSTVFAIAHRLKTVIDYDRVVVMDKGKIMEMDSPAVLINDPNTIFHSMCQDSGEYDHLVKMAGHKEVVMDELSTSIQNSLPMTLSYSSPHHLATPRRESVNPSAIIGSPVTKFGNA